MGLSEKTKSSIVDIFTRYCNRRIPPLVRNQLDLDFTIKGTNVTLIESKASFEQHGTWYDTPIAQFRLNKETKHWMLYYRSSSKRWQTYAEIQPTAEIVILLDEVDRDPSGVFWSAETTPIF